MVSDDFRCPLPNAWRETVRTVRTYGTASGLDVVLITEADPDTVSPLRLSVIDPAPVVTLRRTRP